jgi:hypothetical protein
LEIGREVVVWIYYKIIRIYQSTRPNKVDKGKTECIPKQLTMEACRGTEVNFHALEVVLRAKVCILVLLTSVTLICACSHISPLIDFIWHVTGSLTSSFLRFLEGLTWLVTSAIDYTSL